MLFRYVLTILLCCCMLNAYSQSDFKNSNDSLAFEKADLAFKMASRDSDSAMLLSRDAYQVALSVKNERTIGNALNAMGWTMMHKGHFDSSILLLEKSWKHFSSYGNLDDIVRVSINISEVYIKQNKLKEALTYLVQADSICQLAGNKAFHTNVKRQMGIVYRESGDLQKASDYLQQAMTGFASLGDHARYIGTGTSVSILYRNLGLYDSSLSVLQRCLKLAETTENTSPYAFAMLNEHIAETWYVKQNYSAALKYYREAYNIFEKLGNKADMAFEAFSIGKTLARLNHMKEAESFLLRSYNINDSLKMLNYQLDASNELAALYKGTGNWEQAYKFLQKASELKDSIGLSEQIQRVNELKEKFETEKKEQQIALLQSKHEITKWLVFSGILLALLTGLSYFIYIYRKRIRQEKVLNHFATSLYNKATVDDVLWDVARNCVEKLGFEECVVYDYDENREMLIQKAAFGPKNPEGRVISNLLELPLGKGIVGSVAQSGKAEIIGDTRHDDRYIVDDAERRSEITVPILSDGKLLGIIDSEHSRPGFFKKKHLDVLSKVADITSKKISRHFIEENLRRKISRDLHDDIGSALSSIEISSRIALAKKEDPQVVISQLEKIHQHSRITLESMSDLIWSINPQNDSVDGILIRMRQFAAELCEPLGIALDFDVNVDAEHLAAGPDKRQHIFLIFKEAVNNAVKYSGCTSLKVGLKQLNNQLTIQISDNGSGFDKRVVKNGNGLRNMKSRAELLKGNLDIHSEAATGTTVFFSCPA